VTCTESNNNRSLFCLEDAFYPFLTHKCCIFFGSVHAYIVYKTEQSAQASLSHNMSLVCPWLSKLRWIGSNMLFTLYFFLLEC